MRAHIPHVPRGATTGQDIVPVTLPTIVVTRPNNVTAYAAGDVFGAAVDARIQIPDVADAPNQLVTLRLDFLLKDGTGTGIAAIAAFLFGALPPTIFADNDPLALTDADYALRLRSLTSTTWNPSLSLSGGAGTTVLINASAGAAGRRQASTLTNGLFIPNRHIWLYLQSTAAYTPLANGVLEITPSVQRLVRAG